MNLLRKLHKSLFVKEVEIIKEVPVKVVRYIEKPVEIVKEVESQAFELSCHLPKIVVTSKCPRNLINFWGCLPAPWQTGTEGRQDSSLTTCGLSANKSLQNFWKVIYLGEYMKLAIVTGIRERVGETIAHLHEAGIEAFETGYDYFMNADTRTLRETGNELRDSGIQIWSVHAPFGKGFNLSAIDDEQRKQALAIQEKLLPRVALAGVKVLVLHPGVATNNAEETPLMNSLIVESLAQLAPIAEQVGVKLALENMLPKHPGSDSADLRQMVERVNSPSLGVCFDSGHAHVSGDMRAQFEELKDLIITFHVQDNDGTRDMHLQPGYGTTNWQDFSETLESMNFTSPIVIEAKPWGGASDDWMLKEVYSLLKGERLKFSDFGIEGDAGRLTARCPECGHLAFGAPDDWFCRCIERMQILQRG